MLSALIKRVQLLFLFTLALPANAVLSSELILSAPPRESAQAGKKIYQPVAKYLSQLLNRKVTYIHSGNWFNYQNKMRKDKYDIIFDGPHFTAWRIAHIKHEVLVKLPGKLQFMVVTDVDNIKINSGKDVIGKHFCGISPPNLSSLSFLASFGNPILQPKVKGIKGGMGKVFKAFEQKNCSAAVLRNVFYEKKLSQAKRDKLKVIFTSRSMPNQAISVSSRLSRKEKNKVANALIESPGAVSLNGIVKRFSGKARKAFIRANNAEYEGYNKYLEGVIFGW
jgi:ABC-type phosphate/phosphonate transport system substrate-binding protein